MVVRKVLESTICGACRLAGEENGVGSITIVANRRLTYAELYRCRQQAKRLNLDLRMDGSGTVRVRRRTPRQPGTGGGVS